MVLDPDGTIIRIITDESEFNPVRIAHFVERLKRGMSRGISEESHIRLIGELMQENLSLYVRYKLIRL
jgi:hypothetical protein